MPISVNGNKHGLNMSEAEHDLGHFVPMKSMTGAETLKAFKEGMVNTLQKLPADKQFVARVHSDADKSLIGRSRIDAIPAAQGVMANTHRGL